MHQTGRTIWTQHIRDHQEIQPLGNISLWDFNFQNAIPTETMLFPTDALMTHCVYDSSNRDTMTKGGETSSDEMCFNFISYYPKMLLSACIDLSYYTNYWALCLEDVDDSHLSQQQWWDKNVVRMNLSDETSYQPYTPPVQCACNSSCWTAPTVPDWITNDHTYDDNTASSAFSLSPLLILSVVSILMFF